MKKNNNYVLIIIAIILLFSIILTVNAINSPKTELEKKVMKEVNLVKTFYKFNLTPDGTVMTDEQIKIYGGDCEDWTNYYARHLSEFKIMKIIIPKDEYFSHALLIVSDETGYCLVDTIDFYCTELRFFKNE